MAEFDNTLGALLVGGLVAMAYVFAPSVLMTSVIEFVDCGV